MGGYATDTFYLLYRIAPHELKEFGYKGVESFLKKYGVIETIQKLDEDGGKSYRYGRGKKRNVIVKKRPGISPEAVGKYLLHRSCFIRLADVIDGLPPYDEIVITFKMDDMQKEFYLNLQDSLAQAMKTHKIRAMSAMLQSLLCYPDSCVVFPEKAVIRVKNKETGEYKVIDVITAPMLPIALLPKEQELIKLCQEEKSQGRKVLVYVTFTGNRDIRLRLKKILEEKGFKVGILQETIEPKKREEWINKHSHEFDVLITNPELVKLGLDLYEYPTIVFFEVGYNIFTLRQAARRSWRIGQKQPVKVYYFCYENTMQEAALVLTAKKVEQALLLEGDLPEGLATEFSDSGSIIEEMAKALVEGRTYSGAETSWAQMRKKEIESSLGLNSDETIFTVSAVAGKQDKAVKLKPEKISKIDNVTISIVTTKGKKKSVSRMTVKYEEIDNLVKKYGLVQFGMF
ncbi:DEAD/DEAH box helicase [Thermodesulfovibrio sp. 3907-1M]|uniref:DEAD/DEAH box helicase n=1 Tax=Thermodesulfovibrio autotrophicus TaxID=3118333 RepID=A0AAU8GZ22_9BACT